MSNLRLVTDNIALSAALSASSSAGDAVVGNLQLQGKTTCWRSAGTGETITLTFPRANISCVSLVMTNFSTAATMRVQGYTNGPDTVSAIDSGNVVCCPYKLNDKTDFAVNNANTYAYVGGSYATVFIAKTSCEKITITVSDPTNGAGFLDVSYLVAGDYWTPQVNADYGAELSFYDDTEQDRSDVWDMRIKRGGKYRGISFSLSNMRAGDRGLLTKLAFSAGRSSPVFLSLFPESTDAAEEQAHQVYGYFIDNFKLSQRTYPVGASRLHINEI